MQCQQEYEKAQHQSAQLPGMSHAAPSNISNASLAGAQQTRAEAVEPSEPASTGRGRRRTRQDQDPHAALNADLHTPDNRVTRRRTNNRST